jgi:opacity protein-like surface antigen
MADRSPTTGVVPVRRSRQWQAAAFIFAAALVQAICPGRVLAQDTPFAGVVGGLATLSSDSRSQITSQGLSVSAYKPQNGPVLGFLAGIHFNRFLSLQGSYVWNENDLTLSSTASSSNSFYVETRSSSQKAVVVDVLIYFRNLDSRLRPYLGAGAAIGHFSSDQRSVTALSGTAVLPPRHFSSTRLGLHVPVGIDIAVSRRIAIRYSFGETIRHNDISSQLSPPGSRGLANFQNLFGIVGRL